MNEFTLRFLIVGGIIAIIVGFGIWWFFIHNSSDKIAERNGYNLYQAIEYVCETGQEKELKFELEQNRIASLKDEIENGINWVKKKIGLGGPDLEIPIQLYNDPYYKVYWEYFPPEPPYQFGQGVTGTATSIFIPWSEDLPWSSNFLLTVTLDSMFLGMDIFGLKAAAEAGEKGTITLGRKIANKIKDKIESISPQTLTKLRRVWNALENDVDEIVENLGKAKKIVVKGGKLVISEGKFIGKVTAGYTVFCLVTQDKTLGDCLKDGVIVGIGADVAKVTLQKFVTPKVNAYLKDKIGTVKMKFSTKISEIKEHILSYFKDEIEDSFELKELLEEKGWEFDEVTGKIIAKKDSKKALENIINPLEEYLKEKGYPNRVDGIFTIVYEREDYKITGIKEVIADKKSLLTKLKEKVVLPFEEKIALLEEKIMSDKVIDSDSFSIMAKHLKKYFEENPSEALDVLKRAGVKVADEEEALRIISLRLARLEEEASQGLFFVVMEKGSKLEKLIDSLDEEALNLYEELLIESDIFLRPLPSREDFLNILSYRTENIVKEDYNDVFKDPEEAKKLWDLLNEKRLRLKEDVEIFSRGTLGYAILRTQDLYTPLGATYWDRYFSYYGYPSREKPPEGYCQTSCQDGALCVQLGACVRAYPLQACQAKGIDSIKLKRGSIVAPDPRFYLVSPCYAKLRIYQEGGTIYVEPYMPEAHNKKNYCYATAGLVNWYIGTEAGEYLSRCVSSALCAVGGTLLSGGTLAPLTIPDVIKTCLGFGPKFPGLCSVVSGFVGLLIDVYRETQLIYPDVYKNNPTLIDFKISSLN
ncbi:MAG: hypothetical protein QW040_00515 [Candidatus Aenigmatarchaeota archaeon]